MVFFLIWVGIFRAKLGASPQARAHVAKDILHAERGVRGTFYTASAYGKCTHRVPEKTKADSWSERSRDLSEVLAEKYTVALYCIVRSWRLESLRCRIVTAFQPGILSRPSPPPHPSIQISLKPPPPLYVYIEGKGEERRKEI